MGEKEIGNALVGVDLVFHTGEAVAFVLVDLVIDRSATFLDRIYYLLAF